jgi:hypothetical protein
MNKALITIFSFLFLAVVKPGFSQNETDTSGIQHGKTYEIKLKAPVKCIQEIEYDKTGKEPNWKLSEDHKTIYIRDYIINTRIRLKVQYETGREEDYTQSPCSVKLSQSEPAL